MRALLLLSAATSWLACANPLPASTGIQAILCRPELLIEIEAIAMFRTAG